MSGYDELRELDRVAQSHLQSQGFTPRLIECRARLLEEVLPPGSLLDLGCADGILTALLADRRTRVVGVDGSATRLERARTATARFPGVELRRALFDEFRPEADETFDAVVLSCVLEHLPEPAGLLRRASTWLSPGGRIAVIVPNALSLHRRAGVAMGLLPDIWSFSEEDDHLEHQRLYDLPGLRSEVEAAGLTVVESGGYLIKPLPNDAMAELPPELVDAYELVGRELPELSAEIFVVGGSD